MKTRLSFGVLILFVALSVAQATVTVSNVTAAQRPGTKQVDITYDVASTMMPTVSVSLEVKDGETVLPAISLTGDVGDDIPRGTGKSIVWDMGADWNGNVATGVQFSVVAEDAYVTGGDTNAVAWNKLSDRFVMNTYANGDVTVTDLETSLMWLYNASHCSRVNADTVLTHDGEAAAYHAMAVQHNGIVNGLFGEGYGGYTDWTIPTAQQMSVMHVYRSMFEGVMSDHYYTSTYTVAHQVIIIPFQGTIIHWYSMYTTINMGTGNQDQVVNRSSLYVWPCRQID